MVVCRINVVFHSVAVGIVVSVIASPALGQPKALRLIRVLSKYTESLYGLSYKLNSETPNTPGRSAQKQRSQGRIWVSSDGAIRKQEQRIDIARPAGTTTTMFGGLSSARDGWRFRVSRSEYSNRSLNSVGMTVTFYKPNTTGAVAGDVPEGFIEHRTFAEYASDSKVSVKATSIDGEKLWELSCDHPVGMTVFFYFNEPASELVYVRTVRESGDQFGLGALYLPARTMKHGQWVRSTYGPIDYTSFSGRRVPQSVPFAAEASVRGTRVQGVWKFHDYKHAPDNMTTRIAFGNLVLPDDGTRITSQGEEGIRYELRDGRIVKIADSDAVIAARRARMRRGPGARLRWYGLMGVLLVAGVAVFIWRRNHQT